MLLQTNSYIVPKDKRTEHARLIARFRQTLARLGADHFEAYEQVGANWSPTEATGRFVQIMRFRDRKHQQQVQAAERTDPAAQALIKEFCELINFPYQQQQGLFAVGFYTSILPGAAPRVPPPQGTRTVASAPAAAPDVPAGNHDPGPAVHRGPDDEDAHGLAESGNGPVERHDHPAPSTEPSADHIEDLALEEITGDEAEVSGTGSGEPENEDDATRPVER